MNAARGIGGVWHVGGLWMLAPGAALLAASFLLTFVGVLRRSTSWMLVGARLRFVSYGLLFVLLGISFAISGVADGAEIGNLVLGVVLSVMGVLWFYAASDRMFRNG
jgi:hypothetical protein